MNLRIGFWLRMENMVPVCLSTTGSLCILFSSRILQASIRRDSRASWKNSLTIKWFQDSHEIACWSHFLLWIMSCQSFRVASVNTFIGTSGPL